MSSYLIHYGIFGQRKGERRYQNYDGTYTEEGLERKRAARRATIGALGAGIGTTAAIVGSVSKAHGFKEANTRVKLGDKDKAPISAITSGLKDAEKATTSAVNVINGIKNINSEYGNVPVNSISGEKISTGLDKAEKIIRVTGDVLAIAGTVASIYSLVNSLPNIKDRD